MNKKQEKVLAVLDIIELSFSAIGLITCFMVFALREIPERYFFLLISFLLGVNLVGIFKKIQIKSKKPRIIKYSKRILEPKTLKKVSF